MLTEPNEPERVPGAVVWFQMSDRRSVGAKTNQDGRYETLLEPGYEYAVTAGGQQLCDIHRPIFKPKPGSVLRFDFTTTGCGIIDRIVVPAPPDMDPNILDVAPLSPAREMKRNDNRPGYRPYYHSDHDPKAPYWFFEESLPDGNEDRWVAIAFGERGETNGIVTYGPFSLARHIPFVPTTRLPVTISFGTHTVRADSAELDSTRIELTAKGNVSVEDGSPAPPENLSCVIIRLDHSEPK
jgi:hypothetical protein